MYFETGPKKINLRNIAILFQSSNLLNCIDQKFKGGLGQTTVTLCSYICFKIFVKLAFIRRIGSALLNIGDLVVKKLLDQIAIFVIYT